MPSQRDQLLEKLNQYLQSKQRDLQLKPGFCHGLVLLWLYFMLQQHETWFTETINKVISLSHDFTSCDKDIEKFIAYIEWLQHANQYQYSVNQLDFDKLADWYINGTLSFLLSDGDFKQALKELFKQNAIVCFSGPQHSIGVVKRGSYFYVFDPAYRIIQPKIFSRIASVKAELVQRMFQRKYYSDIKMPLQINVLSNVKPSKNSLTGIYQRLLHKANHVDEFGFERMTNLYLACESGNTNMVEDLLHVGANPNRSSRNRWQPLHIAAANGYESIVKLLLQFGAVTTIKNSQGATAADLAKAFHHEEVLALLHQKQ